MENGVERCQSREGAGQIKDIVHGVRVDFRADVAVQLWQIELVPVLFVLHSFHVVGDWVSVFNIRAAEGSHLEYRRGVGIVFLRGGWISDWTRQGVKSVRIHLVS